MATHGSLRIYLGAAPGVGKTYAMLCEAHRRADRGADVVVAYVEDHGRPRTRELLDGLEILPRRTLTHRGAEFTEMDLDTVLARKPRIALVDELAHTNVPGSRHAKRWQDVDELLRAGIDVVSTVNVQHLESLGDVVEGITGVRQQETVPDEVVRRAAQIELVDMDPDALRRRLAHGNVYTPEKVDAALSHYFRPGNLTALRELALLWTADRVDEYLLRYRAEHGIADTWQTRERIVVGLTGGPEGATLIRRAARIAAKGSGSELLAVHVVRSDGLVGASAGDLGTQRRLVEDLGGSYHSVLGADVPAAMLDFARGVDATQIVLGSSRRKAWQYFLGPGVGATVARESGDIDVHIVTHEHAAAGRPRVPGRLPISLGRARTIGGWLLGVAGPPLLTLILRSGTDSHGITTPLLLFLTLTVVAALVGGVFPAIAAALLGTLLLNYFFAPPTHTFTISDPQNLLSLVIFVAVGIAVASVVDLAARRAQQAARSRAETEILSYLAGTVLRGEDGTDSIVSLLDRVRETFAMESAALLEVASPDTSEEGGAAATEGDEGDADAGDTDARGTDERGTGAAGDSGRVRPAQAGGWHTAASVGPDPATEPENADVEVPAGDRLVLALNGRVLPAQDRRVLVAFAAQTAGLLERRRLSEQATRARRLAEGNRIRTALLAAVSHDLRTPLAGIKAAVTSLRSDEVDWSPEDEAELLAGIETGADRLNHLIGNLLDMSRLRTGAVNALLRDIALEEAVPAALAEVPADAVRLELPEALPLVHADTGLLERAVANVVENAVKYSPPGQPVVIRADPLPLPDGTRVEVRVIDRGPGVPEDAKDLVFEPFQRYGDAPPAGTGVGLGLAVARGFTEAMGGTLTAEDTPGGGLSMVFTLPTAPGGTADPDVRKAVPER
ncbi:two-component system, OmpR family, sensor histidine kinase KdpD [Actinacidiphila yanglinensis]|uniref:histidine kinase n=1 Tax=Actinacidiphila yanglinensis TaxID=310779 RepID=A0A1H6B6V5_9ACTN|nr:sensor histidine kinase KdpD [Actinacidiphila yanglinensis]SEG56342.1 two-component system, OmpR family, sensor histidine kinase KdpD [Actinacidiphila yanglinensis]